MKTWVKILLGLATLSPFVFAIAFFTAAFRIFDSAPAQGVEEDLAQHMAIMNAAGLLFSLYFAVILVIFIVHAARNENVHASGMRTTWILLLIILGPWAMPFYWFHHIWRESPPGRRSGPLGLQ